MKVLLDTCAIIWAVSEPGKLNKEAVAVLEHPDAEVFVSPISCAELACLQERGRIKLDIHWKTWFDQYLEQNGWQVIDISLSIIQDAFSLPPPFHPDPADRIIAATARECGLRLITGDRKLISYPFVDTV
ncbi:MAG: type II toxin-antitoxin system VapC family toxin [Verrucomicrobia bacterium]|nr:type II toxin-antitoxin system VapC family toxin [Verrucomicrobiota bacterium]